MAYSALWDNQKLDTTWGQWTNKSIFIHKNAANAAR